ncbi:MAG TPA: FABP family protein [Acidimicrobiales bacterium]|nr:FABP family protein [Acidimicrobiales bacterium]
MDGPALHPDVVPLAFLLGSWMGEGKGFYNTIEPFEYGEEIRISHVGKPVLAYTQRTWSLDDGRPLHSETGFWRMAGADGVELVIAHPNGHAEVAEGKLAGTSISLASTAIVRTSTAKRVDAIEREVNVAGEVMTYSLRMAAMGNPLDGHLEAELRLGAVH